MTNDGLSEDEVQLLRRRILYIDHTAKMSGGEIALLNMLGYLDRTRFDPVVVLISDGPLREKLEAVQIETYLLPISPRVLETRKDMLGPRTLLRLRDLLLSGIYVLTLSRFMREQNVDLVHTNSLKADILGGFAARLVGIPLLWHIRDRIDADYLPAPIAWLFRRLCHWVPDYVVANSQATLETLQIRKKYRSTAVYSGVEFSARLLVVHDGVPRPPLLQPIIYSGPFAAGLDQTHPQSQRPLLGLVGRISSWKGQHIFLRAAALVKKRFPLVRIQIIGSAMFNEEAYEAEIRALTITLGLEKAVEFLGFRSDIPEIIEGLTVLVHASITAEPFGQVIVEGMIAGKPVVATDGGGAQEIVLSGETGLLVPMNNIKAMAEAILFLLDNPGIAQEMGRRGQQRAQDHFSIERTVRKIESVYDQILQTQADRECLN